MSVKKLSVVLGVLIIASMALTACPAPTPQVVEKVVTQVVEQKVEVIQTQIVEKPVEKIVEKVVVATPAPAVVEKKLRINLNSYPDIIDPQKSSFVNEIAHLKLMYEGLTKLDKDLKTVPGAAAKWEYNADATELTFTLQPDLKYSDGSLLNAARFAYSIKRNINPETAGEYAQITDEIKGAPEVRGFTADETKTKEENAKAQADAQALLDAGVMPLHADGAACDAEKPYEDAACTMLKLTLSKPAPYFHTVMSLWVTYPAKEENIAASEQWYNSSKFQIGNGPFILKSLEPYVKGYFVPNPNYWADKAKVNLEFSYITDSAVAFEAYKNNEFDIITAAAEDLAVIKADAQLSKELTTYPGSCTYAVMFHQLKEPFTDQKVREAFAMALDRQGWVDNVLSGLGSPTLTWIPPGFPGYDAKESRWGFNADEAKKALAASSYGSVDKLPPITDTFSDTPRNRKRNEWLVQKWKDVLGVDIKLDPVEPTTYTALTKNQATAPQMFILGWCADYPDPQNWLSVYFKTGGFGERIAYSNADFDKLVNQADVELDPVKRMDLYAQAQTLLTDGSPVAFMWNNVNNYLVKPWVNGIVTTPQDSDFPGSTGGVTQIDIDTSMLPK
jgi:oligopeptide transport system substrate-binding protein